jgi:hypothetical protein
MDVRQVQVVQDMSQERDWVSWWTAFTSHLAWILANALDVYSVLLAVQSGGRLAFAPHRPAESFLIYAGLRVLGSLAVSLGVLSVSRRWPWSARVAWGALTACAGVTAVAAWWRLYP